MFHLLYRKQALAILGLLSAVLWSPAFSAMDEPSPGIFLRLNSEMHTAPILATGVDKDCRIAVTASVDKSMKIWSLEERRLLHTFRPAIGPGEMGRVNSAAVSPDGQLAIAGIKRDNKEQSRGLLLVVDTGSGQVTRPPIEISNYPQVLVFSQDGGRLAVGMADGGGVVVFETNSWTSVFDDKAFGRRDAYGAGFDQSGNLFMTSYEGVLRKYGPDGTLVKRVMTHSGKRPYGLSVHPFQSKLALGYRDLDAVDIYDSESLKFVETTNVKSKEFNSAAEASNLAQVAWSNDGKQLFAGGTNAVGKSSYQRVDAPRPVLFWTQDIQREPQMLVTTRDTIMGVLSCREGMLVAAQDPALGLVSLDGTRLMFWKDKVTADMRDKLRDKMKVSFDGKRVLFGLDYGDRTPVLFDLENQRLEYPPRLSAGLSRVDHTSIPVKNWEDKRWDSGKGPSLHGKRLLENIYEFSRSLSVAPSKESFVLGAEWTLNHFDKEANLMWPEPLRTPGIAWGVNVAGNGKLFVAAYGDGTIRWHRLDTGKELLALFVNKTNRRWIAWTPSGYYIVSPGGSDMAGWHVNRGWGAPADFFPLSRFRDQYYRPDIVSLILTTLDEEEAVKIATGDNSDAIKPITERLPPVIRIIEPKAGASFSSSEITLKFAVRSPSGLPVSRVFAQVNGRPVEGAEFIPGKRPVSAAQAIERAVDPLTMQDDAIGKSGREVTGEIRVKVPGRNLKLSVVAETRMHPPSNPDTISLKWADPNDFQSKLLWVGKKIGSFLNLAADPDEVVNPTVFAVIIGAGDYDRKEYDLGAFPANDARLFAAELKKQEGHGKAFRKVHIRMLTDQTPKLEATDDNIKKSLTWLDDNIKDSLDIAVFYFSGHGLSRTGGKRVSSYLLPVNFDGKIHEKAISKNTILDALNGLKGSVLMFIDACHAGGDVLIQKTPRAIRFDTVEWGEDFSAEENGVISFFSSKRNQLSYGNGTNSYFTLAVVEALQGKGYMSQSNDVHTLHLETYLFERVPELAKNFRQIPFVRKPGIMDPIRLARLGTEPADEKAGSAFTKTDLMRLMRKYPADQTTHANSRPDRGDSEGKVRSIPKIVGGDNAKKGDFPWQVALIHASAPEDDPFKEYFCGGTLVKEKWVLTAAHCIFRENKKGESEEMEKDEIQVYLDSINFFEGQRIKIKQIHRHKDFDKATYDNDIALLELEHAPTLPNTLSLIPLIPAKGDDRRIQSGKSARVLGWGATTAGELPEPLRHKVRMLKHVGVNFQDQSQCNHNHVDAARVRLRKKLQPVIPDDKVIGALLDQHFPVGKPMLTDNMLCAGSNSGTGDACFGDSGGPLVIQRGGKKVQVGIVSWGPKEGCALTGRYGVYTKVQNYRDWIDKRIN